MTQVYPSTIQHTTISSISQNHANGSLEEKNKKFKQSRNYCNNILSKELQNEANKELLNIFCSLLKKIVQQNSQQSPISSVFDLKGEASMDLSPFIKRISDHFKCSDTCFIMSLILINRLQSENPQIYLHNKNIHKLFITALLIAVKYCDDDCFTNNHYAAIAGIENKELNMLELEFLSMIRFQVYVEESVFRQYSNKIMRFGKTRP